MTGFITELAIAIWETLRAMSPYLIFGFLVAGLLSVYIKPELVERHLGAGGIAEVVKASLLGVPLPLCSCGVIPVVASIRRHGAGKAAAISFLISTPQTGFDSIMVTLSLLGPVFAVFRPLAAFAGGIIGGSAVALLDRDEVETAETETCHGECCSPDAKGSRLARALRYGFGTLPRDIVKPLAIGILAAGLIAAVVPDDFFVPLLGGGIVSMLVMMLFGIPVYVCATASVPIAAALIVKGVSPGAALVFLMTGPATNAATITTVWKIMGSRTALVYLGAVAVCSVAAGLLLDFVYRASAVSPISGMSTMLPQWLKTASALALVVLMSWVVLRSVSNKRGGV